MQLENSEFTLELMFVDGNPVGKFENIEIENVVKTIMSTDQIDGDGLLTSYLKTMSTQRLNETKKYVLTGVHIKKLIDCFYLYATRTK